MEDKKSSIEEAVLEFIDDPTPVDGISAALAQEEHEVTDTEPVKWWDYLLEYLADKLEGEGFRVRLVEDEDRKSSGLYAWWPSETLGHVSVTFGEEEDKTKYGFYYLAVQGAGGIHKYIVDFMPTGMETIYYDAISFRRMVVAIKRSSAK